MSIFMGFVDRRLHCSNYASETYVLALPVKEIENFFRDAEVHAQNSVPRINAVQYLIFPTSESFFLLKHNVTKRAILFILIKV